MMDLQNLFVQAQQNLTVGALDQASDLAGQLAAALPDHPEIISLQANIALAQQNYPDAEIWLKQLMALAPERADIYRSLAAIYLHQNNLSQALSALDAGISAHMNFGNLDEVKSLCQVANSLIDQNNILGWIKKYIFMTKEGIDFSEDLINSLINGLEISSITKYNISADLINNGFHGIGEKLLREVCNENKHSLSIAKNLIDLWLHMEKFREILPFLKTFESSEYQTDIELHRAISHLQCGVGNQAEINEYFHRWGEKYYQNISPKPSMPQKKQPIRLGFCSTWLDSSSFLNTFLQSILPSLADMGVDLFLYALSDTFWNNNLNLNCFTARALGGMAAEDAANVIRQDNLHALITLDIVALSWHPDLYRFRPAPIIFSLIHTLASQGGAVDVLIMDRWFVPPENDHEFPERIVRLSGSTVFAPPSPAAQPLAPPPCVDNGYITFGSFNRPHKIETETAEAWAQAVLAVPESRLYLRSRYYDVEETTRVIGLFEAAGLPASRIIIEGPGDASEFYSSFAKIDIALDPLRFNGGISTVEALWHGVPVVTEPGDIVTSRISASVLSTMGLDAWICRDRQSWLATVTALAQDQDALIRWRQELRPRLTETNICNGTLMAADLLNTITPVIDEYYA